MIEGGRQSDYALIVHGAGTLHLHDNDVFNGGTNIEDAATVVVWDELTSDVHVSGATPETWGSMAPTLWLGGTIHGNVSNDGTVSLQQLCGTGVYQCVETRHPLIDGNFRQSATGTLFATLGEPLQITGSAMLDGTLGLIASKALNYVLPSAPASVLVLHANGGVTGTFTGWQAGSLFLSGDLRYVANDVYFDATAISAAQTLTAASVGDKRVWHAASNFDAALAAAESAQARGNPPNDAQRRLLASAGIIQRLQDYGQAVRTFDSLSGHGYADAADALLQQASLPSADIAARMSGLRVGSKLGAWSGQTSTLASGTGAFNLHRAGFDQWISDTTLLGSSIGWSDGSLRFDRAGGSARDRAPQWDVYVQRFGAGGTYLFGDIGYSHHQLDGTRSIDLGMTGFAVHGASAFELWRTYLEGGRNFRLGNAGLTAFGALGYADLRGSGFVEQGASGFELAAQPSRYARTSASAGLRWGEAWRSGNRITTVNIATGYSQVLHAQADARAAFLGAPEAGFALADGNHARGSGWLQLGLATGTARWNLGLDYNRQASDQALSLHATVGF